jgi:hypothetical protein
LPETAPWNRSLLPLIALVSMAAILRPAPLHAADAPVVEYTAGPSQAFARYLAGLDQVTPWSPETIEIDASLPKLKKQGRLRAIRRITTLGEADYQVLETAGDPTVRKQVIARYLSAQLTAAEIPASSVAITPANYNFHYQGVVKIGETAAYIFRISPRKKRQGLIKGELWLDGETGTAIRQSGYLVKRPSIFVKRAGVTRETFLRGGVAQMRLTSLSIDTRLVGLAELTIRERPFADPGEGSVPPYRHLPSYSSKAK